MYSREEKRDLVVKFWDDFKLYTKQHNIERSVYSKWMLDHTGIKEIDLRFEVDRRFASVSLDVTVKSEDKRLLIYEILVQFKLLIEDGFEEPLEWELLYEKENGQMVSRISIIMGDVDIHKPKHWPKIMDFLYENMTRLQDNFIEIKDVIEDRVKHLYR
ncbi:DUF4268 domain-containing protein [Halosquirtibacter laminarini]|uniref:DUF4268 domain-containing protein n=1 Tax=Halosquirtibacter laminarini TaxID=3374600 RepID=A0AC61NMN1_9BACT|nr:DUF4268 domain-containing protein [Prolixibacteraceae bacterium]